MTAWITPVPHATELWSCGSRISSAIVVAGAPAPTGINNGVDAIDDRVYLRAMYQNGVASVSDAIGAHPSGWANQPELYCCNNDPSVPSFDDHPSFFFRQTLEDYHAIMAQYGDGSKKIWATEFGWITQPPAACLSDPTWQGRQWQIVSDDKQAANLAGAYQYADAHWPWMGGMFVFNLDFNQNPALPECEQIRLRATLAREAADWSNPCSSAAATSLACRPTLRSEASRPGAAEARIVC